MNDDLLERAARALRETTDGADDTGRFTRARVMATLHQRKRRRLSRAAFLLPIAAVLVGSTALASNAGLTSWQDVKESISRTLGGGAPEARERAAKLDRAGLSRGLKKLETSRRPEPVVDAPPSEPAGETAKTPLPAERAVPAPALSAVASAAPPATPDPALELYRVAHDLHFAQGDSARALAAWDRYLSQARGGKFVLEARYNRAICLVRLGRHAEARRALEPFARGAFGSYRKESARSLLDVLDGRSDATAP
jgi:hypothetical protein